MFDHFPTLCMKGLRATLLNANRSWISCRLFTFTKEFFNGNCHFSGIKPISQQSAKAYLESCRKSKMERNRLTVVD